jgi:hypothetical protein
VRRRGASSVTDLAAFRFVAFSVSCSALLTASLPSAHLAAAIDLAYTLFPSPPETSLAELDAAMHALSLARTALAARRVHAQTKLEGIELDRCGFAADEHVEILKSAGLELA